MAQKDQSRVTDPYDFGAAVDAVAGVTPPAQASAPAAPAEDPGSDFGAAVDAVVGQAVAPPPPPTYKGEPPGYQPPTGFWPTTNMVTRRILEKVPLIGPAVVGLGERAIRGPAGSQSRNNLAAQQQLAEQQHSHLAEAADIGGTGLGLSLAAAAAPEMMGMSATDALATAATKAGLTSGALFGLNSVIDNMIKGDDLDTAIGKSEKEAAVNTAGGIAGPVVSRALSALFSNVISPNVARLAQFALGHDVPISADMVSSNPLLRFVRDKLPVGQMGQHGAVAEREGAYWQNVNELAGEQSNRLDTVTLGRMENNIGLRYDQATAGASRPMRGDGALVTALDPVRQSLTGTSTGVTLSPDEIRVINGLLDHVATTFNNSNGAINGQLFKNLTQKGELIYNAIDHGTPNVSSAAKQIRGALTDWFVRNAPPDAGRLMQTADTQWRNMRILQHVVEKYPDGSAPPEALWDALQAEMPKGAIRGNPVFNQSGPMADWASVGKLLMPKTPPTREGLAKAVAWLIHVPGSAGAAAAGVAGLTGAVSPELAMGGAAVGVGLSPFLAAGGIAGSIAARSPVLANALTRASLGTPGAVMRGGPAVGRMGLPFAQGAASEGARALAASQVPEPAR
jgi:hypothetical protein